MNIQDIKIGDLVKWEKPTDAEDAQHVYEIKHINFETGWVDMWFINSGMHFMPQTQTHISNLVTA